MKVGVTGHQKRAGIDWDWVSQHVGLFIREHSPITGFSSLAAGADQVFAEQVLHSQNLLISVLPIPVEKYENYFEPASLSVFRDYLAKSERIQMPSLKGDDSEAFLRAGLFIADTTDLLVAIWDGKPAQGVGGTADIVEHALKQRKEIIHINPIARTSGALSS